MKLGQRHLSEGNSEEVDSKRQPKSRNVRILYNQSLLHLPLSLCVTAGDTLATCGVSYDEALSLLPSFLPRSCTPRGGGIAGPITASQKHTHDSDWNMGMVNINIEAI